MDEGETDTSIPRVPAWASPVRPDHVGLGSDLYGLDTSPKGLEDISKIPALTEALMQRGHSDEVILKFLGGNFMRVFEQVWKG